LPEESPGEGKASLLPAPLAVLLVGEVHGGSLGGPRRTAKMQPRCLLTGVRSQIEAAGVKKQWKVRSRLLLLPVVRQLTLSFWCRSLAGVEKPVGTAKMGRDSVWAMGDTGHNNRVKPH